MADVVLRYRPLHLAFGIYVPYSGWRKGSLDGSGAILAGIFSFFTLVLCPTHVFAISLLSFYFIGSRATKYKSEVKARLEEAEHTASATGGAGNRDWKQVASNGLLGTLVCMLWIVRFGTAFTSSQLAKASVCPINSSSIHHLSKIDTQVTNALVFTAVGFFAACMGDTLASELGMLAISRPRLITNFAVVAPGTNGGVTAWGILVSFLGGQIISLFALLTLVLESADCRFLIFSSVEGKTISLLLLLIGGGAGLFGSLLDSLLGATMQETIYSSSRKMVVHKLPSRKDGGIQRIGRALLSNNGVNVVASWTTGLLCGWIGWHLST